MTSMPEFSPLYPEPPYEFKDTDVIYIYGKCNGEALKEYLPEPLDYVSNTIRFGVHHNRNIEGLSSYRGGTIHVPVKYNDIVGGTLLNEWVTEDDALAVGRELWGYPKKIGSVSLRETADGMLGTVERKGETIFQASFTPTDTEFEPEKLMPRLQVRRIPSVERSSEDTLQVIKMGGSINNGKDGHPGLTIHDESTGTGEVELGHELEPLGPIEVVGATYSNRSFSLDYGEDITAE